MLSLQPRHMWRSDKVESERMTKHGLSVSAAATAVVAFLSGISAPGLQSAQAADSAGPWGSYKLVAAPAAYGRSVIDWDEQHHALIFPPFYIKQAAEPTSHWRSVIDWDRQRRYPLRIVDIPPYGGYKGASVRAYYSGTNHLRMDAEADYSEDVATYYRENGTRAYVLKLYPLTITVQYFDATGEKEVLEQYWYRSDHVKNGKTRHSYELCWVTSMNDSGKPLRQFLFQRGTLLWAYDFNVEVDGVHYAEVDHKYDERTHTLERVFYMPTATSNPLDKTESYTPQDRIAAPGVPAAFLTMRINPDKDLLLIPPLPFGFQHPD